MKTAYKPFLYFLLILAFLSCNENSGTSVVFSSPQPFFKKNLSYFPLKYQGTYIGHDSTKTGGLWGALDSIELIIDSFKILKCGYDNEKLAKTDMEEEDSKTYWRDTLFEDEGLLFGVKITDSIATISIETTDTIFQISDKIQLREYKNCLFINYLNHDTLYNIKTLRLNKDKLDFSNLLHGLTADSVKIIFYKNCLVDSVSKKKARYILNLNRKNLKDLMKYQKKDFSFRKIL